jgi:predicted ATPase/transcriptional regulator with XRE-family HTH domain
VADGRTPAFGELLRRYRLAAGFSQEQLAERARVSRDAVGTLERGARRAPQRQTLALLAEALALNADEQAALESAVRRHRPSSRPTRESPTPFPGAKLPIDLTSFVGRATEVAELVDRVRESRLVTVVGAGGIGKTRLACAAVAVLDTDFARVAFVDLSRVTNPDLLSFQIASTLLIEAQPQNAAERIGNVLARQRTLLLLDNCEHILEPIALLTAQLLQLSPVLHVLATSRERLGVNGEHVCRLQPLAPAEALELFVERAQEADRHFALSDALIPAAEDVVRRLEGIPLAIELSVARLAALGLPELRRRLDRLFTLPGANRDAPARQQTMQSTIAWSYDLLAEPEKVVLSRLAIFVGGFSLEVAEMVCSCEFITADDVTTIVPQLVERSIVQMVPGDSPRYRLLEPVRLYGLQQLVERETYALLVRRHASWLADVGDAANAEMVRGPTRDIVRGMRSEIDNVRAALGRLLVTNDIEDLVLAARIAGGLRTLWISLGAGQAEGQRWSAQILARLNEDEYPGPYGGVIRLNFQTTNGPEDVEAAYTAIAYLSKRGDHVALALVYAELIERLCMTGDADSARDLIEASRVMFDGDLSLGPGRFAFLAGMHGMFYASQGDFARAHANLALADQILGEQGEFANLAALKADIAAQEGHYERAAEIAEAGVAHWPDGYLWKRLLAENTVASYRFLAGDLESAASTVHDLLLDGPNIVTDHFIFDEVLGLAAAIAAVRGHFDTAARLGAYVDATAAWERVFRGTLLVRTRLESELGAAFSSDERAARIAEGRRLTQSDAMRIALEALR